jgi:MoaA/NifB/PqqE/SkfB family radical SAM enzyme
MPKERVKELIDEAAAMRVHEITIRGGEATEHPHYGEIWKHALAAGFPTPTLITNGMALNRESIDRMLERPDAKVVVSLDGFREVNSFQRNPRQYDLVMSWLPDAAERYRGQVVVLSCLYRQNISGIPDFAEHLAGLGVEHYHLPPLKRLGRSEMADSNFVSLKEMDALQNYLDGMRSRFPAFKPVISCASLAKYGHNKTSEIPVPLFNEMHYGTALKITPEGNVMVNRGIMFTDRFKNGVNTQISLEPLGNIHEQSLTDIWDASKDLRLEQGMLADKHYAYYLGWLRQLE